MTHKQRCSHRRTHLDTHGTQTDTTRTQTQTEHKEEDAHTHTKRKTHTRTNTHTQAQTHTVGKETDTGRTNRDADRHQDTHTNTHTHSEVIVVMATSAIRRGVKLVTYSCCWKMLLTKTQVCKSNHWLCSPLTAHEKVSDKSCWLVFTHCGEDVHDQISNTLGWLVFIHCIRSAEASETQLRWTAVVSNDVGAAAEYPSAPRPIIGCHHLLLLHLKTECNTMSNPAWAHASKIVGEMTAHSFMCTWS